MAEPTRATPAGLAVNPSKDQVSLEAQLHLGPDEMHRLGRTRLLDEWPCPERRVGRLDSQAANDLPSKHHLARGADVARPAAVGCPHQIAGVVVDAVAQALAPEEHRCPAQIPAV